MSEGSCGMRSCSGTMLCAPGRRRDASAHDAVVDSASMAVGCRTSPERKPSVSEGVRTASSLPFTDLRRPGPPRGIGGHHGPGPLHRPGSI